MADQRFSNQADPKEERKIAEAIKPVGRERQRQGSKKSERAQSQTMNMSQALFQKSGVLNRKSRRVESRAGSVRRSDSVRGEPVQIDLNPVNHKPRKTTSRKRNLFTNSNIGGRESGVQKIQNLSTKNLKHLNASDENIKNEKDKEMSHKPPIQNLKQKSGSFMGGILNNIMENKK